MSIDRRAPQRFLLASVLFALTACGGGSNDGCDPDDVACNTSSSSTTMTSVTTSTTLAGSTTTLAGTTTTTLAIEAADVTFTLAEAVTLGALQFVVDYGSASGRFAGDGSDVDCTALLGGSAIQTMYHDAVAQRLSIGAISLAGFTGPIDVMRCRFHAAGAVPADADFGVGIVDATGPDLIPVVPLPAVEAEVGVP